MKLTKSRLKEIIKEELELSENQMALGDEKERIAQARQTALDIRGDVAASGITDQERALVSKVAKQLQVAAQGANITTGPVARRLALLFQELEKLLSQKQPAEPTEPDVGV